MEQEQLHHPFLCKVLLWVEASSLWLPFRGWGDSHFAARSGLVTRAGHCLIFEGCLARGEPRLGNPAPQTLHLCLGRRSLACKTAVG